MGDDTETRRRGANCRTIYHTRPNTITHHITATHYWPRYCSLLRIATAATNHNRCVALLLFAASENDAPVSPPRVLCMVGAYDLPSHHRPPRPLLDGGETLGMERTRAAAAYQHAVEVARRLARRAVVLGAGKQRVAVPVEMGQGLLPDARVVVEPPATRQGTLDHHAFSPPSPTRAATAATAAAAAAAAAATAAATRPPSAETHVTHVTHIDDGCRAPLAATEAQLPLRFAVGAKPDVRVGGGTTLRAAGMVAPRAVPLPERDGGQRRRQAAHVVLLITFRVVAQQRLVFPPRVPARATVDPTAARGRGGRGGRGGGRGGGGGG